MDLFWAWRGGSPPTASHNLKRDYDRASAHMSKVAWASHTS